MSVILKNNWFRAPFLSPRDISLAYRFASLFTEKIFFGKSYFMENMVK